MSEIIKNKEKLIETMKEIGNRQLFLAETDNLGCHFVINKDSIEEDNNEESIQCYMRDLHEDILNITTFVFAIKLNQKVYIAFVNFKNTNSVKIIKNIISQEQIKVRIVNEYEDYMLYFSNPSIEDFSKLFDEVSLAVKNETYTQNDFDKFTINFCNTYTNEELWEIWKEEIENESSTQ